MQVPGLPSETIVPNVMDMLPPVGNVSRPKFKASAYYESVMCTYGKEKLQKKRRADSQMDVLSFPMDICLRGKRKRSPFLSLDLLARYFLMCFKHCTEV